ncbi:MAG: TonB-dependent receptor [Erythrobacter sp.]
MITHVSRLALAACLIGSAAPVFAQDAAPAQDVAADATAPADEGGVEEIIVTATKRETNLQKTPVAISVVTAQNLQERRVLSLLDLADGSVPSLRVQPFESRQTALTIGIRGIVPLDANQPAREQGVGIYIDGVYLGRQHGMNAGLFDLERVEVLKGPQGTLFGRNTEGGALSLVSKAPSGEFGGRITAGIGNLGTSNISAHLDLPEVAGFSVKIDGIMAKQGAVTRNPLLGQVGWGFFDRKGVRAAVRWQPTSNITNDFAFDYATDRNSPFYSQLLNYNPRGCVSGGTNTAPQPISVAPACTTPGTAFTGTSGNLRPVLPGVQIVGDRIQRVADIGVPQAASRDKTFGYTNNFKWQIADEIELRSITAWRGVDALQYDNAGGAHRVPLPAPGCTGSACNFSRYSVAELYQRQFSQEFQAVGTIGRVNYVAGLFYFIENVRDTAATPNTMAIQGYTTAGQTTGFNYVVLDSCRGSAGFGWDVGCRSIDRASEVRSRSYAAYGQAEWEMADGLRLTVGGRYTIDKKEGELTFSRGINYRTDTAAAIRNGYAPLDRTWKRFNPMVTLAYDVNPDVHVYAKYATGYRSGGASSRTSNYQAFGPEDVKSYEVGLKTDLFDRTVRFNVAAYMMDRTNSQVDLSTIQPTATGNFNNLVTINAPGTTKIRGIEADLTWRPTERWTFNASYAYTYTDIPPIDVVYEERRADGTLTGNRTVVPQKFYIVYTPRNAASGSVDYKVPVGGAGAELRFHVDAAYSQATQTFDQFPDKADASFIVNGRISLARLSMGAGGQELQVSLWGRNIFNEQYLFRRDPSNSLPAVQVTALSGVPNALVVGNKSNILGDYGNFAMPRTFGIESTLRF